MVSISWSNSHKYPKREQPRSSHSETTLKQKVHKLKISIIELFNPSIRHVLL